MQGARNAIKTATEGRPDFAPKGHFAKDRRAPTKSKKVVLSLCFLDVFERVQSFAPEWMHERSMFNRMGNRKPGTIRIFARRIGGGASGPNLPRRQGRPWP